MPKVDVYLPDDLYRAARARGLPISALAQQAIEKALRRQQADEWVARLRSLPPRVRRSLDTIAAMDAARDEFAT